MMNTIEEGLKPLEGYLISLTRNTVKGWYEVEIGIPKGWVFKGNEFISCETLETKEKGYILKIAPKVEGIVVDDLFNFIVLVMNTNSKIGEKEKEFTEELNTAKKELEIKAKTFHEELKDLRDKSFDMFVFEKLRPAEKPTEKEKKTQPKKRGRKPKVKDVEENE